MPGNPAHTKDNTYGAVGSTNASQTPASPADITKNNAETNASTVIDVTGSSSAVNAVSNDVNGNASAPPPTGETADADANEVTPLLSTTTAATSEQDATQKKDAKKKDTKKKRRRRWYDDDEDEDLNAWIPKYKELLRFAMRTSVPSTTQGRIFSFLAVVLRAVRSGCSILTPLMLKNAIDSLSGPEIHTFKPYTFIILYVVVQMASDVVSRVRSLLWSRVVRNQSIKLSVASFAHVHAMSLGYLYRQKIGRLNYKISRGRAALSSLVRMALFEVIPMVIETVVVTSVLIHFKSPGIAAVIFITVFLYIGLTVLLTPIDLKYREAENEVSERLFHKKFDSLFNYETVKYFANEDSEAKQYEKLLREEYDIDRRRDGFNLWSSEAKTFITKAGLWICLWLSVRAVVRGEMSAGSLVAVNTYYYQLFHPLTDIGNMYRSVSKYMTDLAHFVDFIYTKPQIQDKPDACNLVIPRNHVSNGVPNGVSNGAPNGDVRKEPVPHIEFRNVQFSYVADGEEKPAVQGISFKVPPGHRVALVGASGSGKTTIIRLLLRLFDVKSGQVLINGRDARDVTIKSLREQIGIVAQETVLFSETLRYNIAYGKPDATDAEIYAAARSAALGEFLEGLEHGLDTECGERGIRLSGGERQRVGLARMLVSNPPIIALDESTASLDTMTEREIQKNLQTLCDSRTVVAIAHRLSTIMNSDEILVIEKGKIVERGNHEQLLALGPKGLYARMWGAQVGAFIGDIEELEENGEKKKKV